jgi:hypothetical protein
MSVALPARFAKVSLNRKADSLGPAFTIGYTADVGRVNPKPFGNAREKALSSHVGAEECHCLCHA